MRLSCMERQVPRPYEATQAVRHCTQQHDDLLQHGGKVASLRQGCTKASSGNQRGPYSRVRSGPEVRSESATRTVMRMPLQLRLRLLLLRPLLGGRRRRKVRARLQWRKVSGTRAIGRRGSSDLPAPLDCASACTSLLARHAIACDVVMSSVCSRRNTAMSSTTARQATTGGGVTGTNN